jgi:hypothetical protein
MGQPVTVRTSESARPGIVRLDVNRSLTGMAVERYEQPADVIDDRPADLAAERLLSVNGVEAVQVSSNVITVETDGTAEISQLQAEIEELFTYYRDGSAPTPVGGSSGDS